jgi:hypothetical protein
LGCAVTGAVAAEVAALAEAGDAGTNLSRAGTFVVTIGVVEVGVVAVDVIAAGSPADADAVLAALLALSSSLSASGAAPAALLRNTQPRCLKQFFTIASSSLCARQAAVSRLSSAAPAPGFQATCWQPANNAMDAKQNSIEQKLNTTRDMLQPRHGNKILPIHIQDGPLKKSSPV